MIHIFFALIIISSYVLSQDPGSNIDENYCVYWDPNIPLSNQFCNVSRYSEWREIEYQGYLKTEPTFWRYQAQTQFKLTNGLALDFAVQKCKAKFTNLISFKSGRHGPGN